MPTIFLSLCLIVAGDLVPGQIAVKVACREAPDKSYALYLPSGYTPDRAWPVLLLFEPAARAKLPLAHFREAAERRGYILACSHDTRNFQTFEGSYAGASAMWNDVVTRFRIDPNRIYLGGFSGGARLATGLALLTEKAAGVIACGAGFNAPGKPVSHNPFPMVLTIGTTDMNYLELAELETQLASKQIPHRRLIFDDGHVWPPADLCGHALAFFDRLAEQTTDGALVARGIAARQELADHWRQAGQVAYEARVLRFLVDDFPDRADLDPARQRLSALSADKGLKAARKAERKLLRREQAARDQFFRRMDRGGALPVRMAAKRKAELAWWRREIDALRQTEATEPSSPQGVLARRLLNFLRGQVYERPVVQLQQSAYDQALFLSELAAIVSPNAAYPHFNQARAHAGAGRPEQALAALEVCVARGVPAARIAASTELAGLRDDPRFTALLDRAKP